MLKRKIIGILVLVSIVVSTVPATIASAATKNASKHSNVQGNKGQRGWIKKDNKWYYINNNGSLAKGWIELKGVWYYLDNNGAMKTGWILVKDKWYYMDNSGAMKTSWIQLNNKWYYLDNSGAMKTGWLQLKDKKYYLNPNGDMVTSKKKIDNKTYEFNSDGSMKKEEKRGWIEKDNKWIYINDNGTLAKGWLNLKGIWYYMDNNGVMKTDWILVKDKWYYMDKSGAMKTGWLQLKDKKYYLNPNGDMVTGKKKIDNKTYEFNSDGSMKKEEKRGWIEKDNKWIYINENGTLAKGWLNLKGVWYYMDNNGVMKTDWILVKDKWYYMDKSGAMKTGWLQLKDKKYYLNPNGDMVTGKKKIDNKLYEFNSDGSLKGEVHNKVAKGKLRNYTMNLREKPSLQSRVLTKMAPGSKLEILDKVKGDLTYYKVEYVSDNKTYSGYVSSDLNGASVVDIYDDNENNEFLGVLSEKYESNGNPGCISSGVGDYGGKSYGAWQLSSSLGSLDGFVNWLKGENNAFYKKLTDARKLDNGSNCGKNFDKAWKELATNDYNDFYNLQHKYTKENFYDDLVNRLLKTEDFKGMLSSFAVRNVLWSTAVQHGGYGAFRLISPLPYNTGVENFITSVYSERGRKNSDGNLVHFPNCSKAVQKGVASRYLREEEEAIRMYENSL
ncbi:MAG: SH3 domain-containing protein [Clostridium sp.]|uniref:SH3 domain-containing protein n=1 Tax=Clostridium sp. TaxID=1506 RepID=UPI003F2B285A